MEPTEYVVTKILSLILNIGGYQLLFEGYEVGDEEQEIILRMKRYTDYEEGSSVRVGDTVTWG